MQKKSSSNFLYFLSLTLFFAVSLTPRSQASELVTWEQLPISQKYKKAIKGDYRHVSSQLENLKNKAQQKLNYSITGLHSASCDVALPKLSLYEDYKDYLGFIKKSSYVESEKLINLTLGHALLPFDMGLSFKLERITKPGLYKFEFERGFLRGLKGEIHVSESFKRCLFHAKAKWTGPHTGISPTVFSFFSTTLSRMAMDGLFRSSRSF